MEKTIQFGILGCARITPKLIYAIDDSKYCSVKEIASRSEEKAKQWAQKYNIEKYCNYDELIESKNIQAIYIPLPTGMKYEYAKRALENKKHVLLEKPFPQDIEQVKELIEISKQNGCILYHGTMWLHSLRTKEILEKIKFFFSYFYEKQFQQTKQEIQKPYIRHLHFRISGMKNFYKEEIQEPTQLWNPWDCQEIVVGTRLVQFYYLQREDK